MSIEEKEKAPEGFLDACEVGRSAAFYGDLRA
jgi:hypothetical protein